MNILKKGYQKFDDLMMYAANKSVHAYNFTTGKTKADLANLLLDTSIISIFAGFAVIHPIFTPVGLVHYSSMKDAQKKYIELEHDEAIAANQCLKDLNVESNKEINRKIGVAWLGASSVVASLIPLHAVTKDYKALEALAFMSVGFNSASLASFVIRTDYLPPQKNCISRGIDKLTDLIASHKTQPVHASINYSTRLLRY